MRDMNFYSDSSEWRYLFRNAVDWDTLLPLYGRNQFPTKDGFRDQSELIDFYEELLSASGQWAAESVATRAAELDRVGGGSLVQDKVVLSEVLQKTYTEAAALDLLGMSLPTRFGGLGAPALLHLVVFAQLSRACVSTSTQIGFFSGIADMIERFCDAATQERLVPMIRQFKISGSMCLTEPGCGSDLGSIRTTAVKQADGRYLLNGSKCFITNGGGGLAFVLARIPGGPVGLKGLSLFFAEENLRLASGDSKHNYRVTRIEDKMGMHGSITCEVVYDNTVAELVGAEHDGFKLMLFLMNEARISVGLQGLGGIEASLAAARDYASQRQQFGKPLLELPLFRRNLQDWETEQDALRALLVDTLSFFDIFQKLDLKNRVTAPLAGADLALFKKAQKVVRKRTPLVKFYGAESYAELSQKAIQAFGGYGYMKEYNVERLHRDSFGALLYEGTSQIQALMSLKDFMQDLLARPQNFLKSLATYSRRSTETAFHNVFSGKQAFNLEKFELQWSGQIFKLLFRIFGTQLGAQLKTLSGLSQLKKAFQAPAAMDALMTHSETFCKSQMYLETLRVLAKHAKADPQRKDLLERYALLVQPKLAAIYADWNLYR